MGTSGLPDIYQSTRVAGLRAEGVCIRQTTRAHVTAVMYHLFKGQKPMQTPKFNDSNKQ